MAIGAPGRSRKATRDAWQHKLACHSGQDAAPSNVFGIDNGVSGRRFYVKRPGRPSPVSTAHLFPWMDAANQIHLTKADRNAPYLGSRVHFRMSLTAIRCIDLYLKRLRRYKAVGRTDFGHDLSIVHFDGVMMTCTWLQCDESMSCH